MVQCREKSSHDCRSDRLTVSTVAATVTVTAAVTVLVTAVVTATAMDTQIYRDKKRLGPQSLAADVEKKMGADNLCG